MSRNQYRNFYEELADVPVKRHAAAHVVAAESSVKRTRTQGETQPQSLPNNRR
nr:hypothetical protein [Paenibacillus chinjuensis]